MPPPTTIKAFEHPTHRSLQLLDPTLELWFNTKLGRYELWRYELTPLGINRGFIQRVVSSQKDQGFAEPGDWFIDLMKSRDPRHRPASEVVALLISEFNADEDRVAAKREAEFDRKIEDISREAAPVFMRMLKDDSLFGRLFRGFRGQP